MKNIIKKPAPALFGKTDQNNKLQEAPALFKKHNFFVDINGEFKSFSYEANFDEEFVSIKVRNASTGKAYLKLDPTITRIAKRAVDTRYGTMNVGDKVIAITYEEFCEALFKYICEAIADGQGE